MRSCGPRPGTAMVHATPAAIKRNARLPRTNATSGDTRGSPNIGIPTQAIHASAGDQATRNRIADRARPISRPSRLTTACRSARVTRPPGTASTDIRPHTIETNTGMDANPLATRPRSASPPAGKFAAICSALVCQLLNLRRDDRGGTSELVGRNRRIARGDLRRRSSHTEKRFELRRLGPEPVARELRAKMRRDILLRRSSLLLSLELGIGTRVSDPRHPPHERLRRSDYASLSLEGSRDHGKHHGDDQEKYARRHRRHHDRQGPTAARGTTGNRCEAHELRLDISERWRRLARKSMQQRCGRQRRGRLSDGSKSASGDRLQQLDRTESLIGVRRDRRGPREIEEHELSVRSPPHLGESEPCVPGFVD